MHGAAQAKPGGESPRYAAKREAILIAGTETLAQDGLAGFTLAGVAKRMGLHPVSLTYYFKRREELAAACLLHGVERVEAMLAQAERAATPAGRLTAFIGAYFETQRRIFQGEAPALAPLEEVRPLWRGAGDAVDGRYRQLRQRIADLIGIPDQPQLSGWQQRLISRLIMQQLASSEAWLGDYSLRDYPRIAERVADIMIDGLASPGHRWPRDESIEIQCPDGSGAELIRQRFLTEATDLINREGWTGASVDRISARLQVTKGSFYHHHADKDELIGACFDRSFTILEGALARAAPANNGWVRLWRAAAPLAVSQAHRGRSRMLRRHALRLAPPELREQVSARMRQTANAFAGVISDGIADGSLRPVDSGLAAHLVLAMINSAAMLDRIPQLTPEVTLYGYVRPALRGVFSVRPVD